MKKNLNKLRSDIDKIDRDILDLLSKRAAIAKDIGTLKNDGVIYKPEREASLIAKLKKLNQGPLSQASVINIFKSYFILERPILFSYILNLSVQFNMNDI